ncbi:hypothetical protein ACPVPU_05050 [Sphingomonas sp. CJ99]
MSALLAMQPVPATDGGAAATAARGGSMVTINLTARVERRCAVGQMRVIDLATGRLAIDVACNDERFAIAMGGDLDGMAVQSVRAADTSTLSTGSGFSVTAHRPGIYQFELDYGRDLSSIGTIVATLQTI